MRSGYLANLIDAFERPLIWEVIGIHFIFLKNRISQRRWDLDTWFNPLMLFNDKSSGRLSGYIISKQITQFLRRKWDMDIWCTRLKRFKDNSFPRISGYKKYYKTTLLTQRRWRLDTWCTRLMHFNDKSSRRLSGYIQPKKELNFRDEDEILIHGAPD